jgi:aspartyl-tRNA(Asn)/glutamyl-tRNA(Gln) amidotransferase subunit B
MRSAAEAVAYAKALHSLVVWLGVCDGNMQEGSFRCDANVSVRPFGQKEFGTRCEIKNLNSFRFLEEAINYEVRRQIELIEDGGTVVQETRLYDPDRQETRSMRSKEDAHDYRYFPDPDLLPLIISQEWIEEVRSSMPPLPATLREQWQTNFGLSAYDAQVLSQDRASADLFTELIGLLGAAQAKLISNFITGELASALNRSNLQAIDAPLNAKHLSHLLRRLMDGTISAKIAKDIFALMWEEALNGKEVSDVDQIIESRGLKQITDSAALEALIDSVLQANTKSVEEFRAGKEKAFNALVGQVMKASQGKANPQQLNELLRQKLQSS